MAYMDPLTAPGLALAEQINQGDIPNPPEVAEDQKILAIVMQDVRRAEQLQGQRATLYDSNLRLYLSYVPKERWAGTNLSRAALSVPLVLEHSNAVNAQVMDIMFEDDPPFEIAETPGTTEMVRRATSAILAYQLDATDAEMEFDGISLSGLIHGTTIAKAYWEPDSDGRLRGRLEHIERQDMIVDPACRWPDIRVATWKAHRLYKTVAEVDALRNVPGYYNIPSTEELKSFGIEPREVAPSAPTDNQVINLHPEWDVQQPRSKPTSLDPRQHPLQLLEYRNKDYVYTVLSEKRIIRKQYDPKQLLCRYFSAFFIRVERQFDGVGHAWLIGDEQRLQQGLINGSLDQFNLSLFGFYFAQKGTNVFPQQVPIAPGRMIPVDVGPDKDIRNALMPGQIPSFDNKVFTLVSDSDQRAARRTGANEVSVQGSFPQSGAGIGRTAQGMGLLARASSTRMRKYVRTLENQIFIPFLEYLVETNKHYFDAKLAQSILGDELGVAFSMLDTKAVLQWGSKCKFRMLGSIKMKRRDAALQSVPYVMEFLQNEFIQQSLKDQRLKTDVNEALWMVTDMTGYPMKGNLVVEMSKAEKKALDQENTMAQQLAMQRAQTQIQTDAKIQQSDAENAGRAFRDMLKASTEAQQQQQGEQDQAQYDAGAAAANSEIDRMMAGMNVPRQ